MSAHPAAVVLYNEACRAAQEGRHEDAIKAFDDALMFDPHFDQALINLCSMVVRNGNITDLTCRLERIASLRRGKLTSHERIDFDKNNDVTTLSDIKASLDSLITWSYSSYQVLYNAVSSYTYISWRDKLDNDRKILDNRVLYLYGEKFTSQNDEDGILNEIFRRIGVTNRFLVEFGVSSTEANSLNLLQQGWSGLWMDSNSKEIADIKLQHGEKIKAGKLKVVETFITAENIEGLLKDADVPTDMDYFSIDIDGNDYYIWEAVVNYSPRVVSVEYNGQIDPNSDFVMPYDPAWPGFQGDSNFGCGLKKLTELAESKGYALVGCNFQGVNAFFVRRDLLEDKFYAPGDVQAHFRPLVWKLFNFPVFGHPLKFYR